MTNELTLLKQEMFEEVLVDVYRNEDNEVFMTSRQLGDALQYSDKKSIEKIVERNDYLKNGEFSTTVKLSAVDGKLREARVFTEDGIYEVTMLSKQPKAREFRSFVRKLMKGLRKGEVEIMRVPRNYLEALKEMTALVEMNQELGGQVDELTGKVSEYEPKAEYLDTILASNDTVNTTQIAKDYGLSAQALNRILREDGIQYQTGGQGVLYGKHVNKGYTKSHTHNYGGRTVMQTRWTQKGRLLVHETLKARGIIANMDKEE